MRRTIITPAALDPAALDELKQWLAITTAQDDAALTLLLRASLDMCEAFTGQMPLEALCKEVLPAAMAWQILSTRPVQAVTGIERVLPGNSRTPVPPESYEFDLEADGTARVRLHNRAIAGRVAVRFTAGIAPQWSALPDGLRHGILRLAAHHYRQRDGAPPGGSGPPAAIAALWSPWRRLRLT